MGSPYTCDIMKDGKKMEEGCINRDKGVVGMRYISSDDKRFALEVEASIHKHMENFALVEKTYTLDESVVYDCYELSEEEAKRDFKAETLESFTEKYIGRKEPDKSRVTSVEIFQGGESVTEISRPIEVLVFEAGKPVYVKTISKTRTAYMEIVEGDTEYVPIAGEYILVCNEVGMLINLAPNRGYHGTFFIAKNIDGYCDSLTKEDVERLTKEFDKKESFESKSKYLQNYFQNNPIERQLLSYRLNDNNVCYIGTESIIEFLLNQEDEAQLKLIELEVKSIEEENEDILDYLKYIGKQMAQMQG